MATPHGIASLSRPASWFLILAVGLVGCSRSGSVFHAQDTARRQPDGRAARLDLGHEFPSQFNTETYDSIVENEFIAALDEPQSTFSVDVDTAAYSNLRRMITDGVLPPPGAVRLEELVNYFDFDYPEPDGPHPFSVQADVADCPWNEQNRLLRIGLRGQSIDSGASPGCNLVFLLDVSGSMQAPDKLPLVKTAMHMLTENLQPQDRIAIVVYASASGLVLESTAVAESARILGAIERLQAGGSTNGGEGLELAYRVAEEHFVPEGINRVILCTDGDFNVGVTDHSRLIQLIEDRARSGVFLSVLGFGRGNLKDSIMEKLADRGNGNYGYIDTPLEARKMLVEQIGGTLVTIAKDVKIQLDFNPLHVAEYRLLGYENRLLENRDFRDDQKDAGEIGSGHCVTAFYELVPAKGESSSSADTRPSEFVKEQLVDSADPTTMLTVNLRYKLPNDHESLEFQLRVPSDSGSTGATSEFRFASAVLGYGMLLRHSQYAGSVNWDWVIETASSNIGEDPRGIRSEFVRLATRAKRLME